MNSTLIHDVWLQFMGNRHEIADLVASLFEFICLDALENVAYFHEVQTNLLAIGTSISDALTVFLRADETFDKNVSRTVNPSVTFLRLCEDHRAMWTRASTKGDHQ